MCPGRLRKNGTAKHPATRKGAEQNDVCAWVDATEELVLAALPAALQPVRNPQSGKDQLRKTQQEVKLRQSEPPSIRNEAAKVGGSDARARAQELYAPLGHLAIAATPLRCWGRWRGRSQCRDRRRPRANTLGLRPTWFANPSTAGRLPG